MIEPNFTTGSLPENQAKNRYSAALPSDNNRVLLEIMEENVATSYINAAYVDSYKHRNKYILTQSPLDETVSDFWRMLCEHASTTLVMLNAVDEGMVRESYNCFFFLWFLLGKNISYLISKFECVRFRMKCSTVNCSIKTTSLKIVNKRKSQHFPRTLCIIRRQL